MGQCPHIRHCELFPFFERTPMIKFWKQKYCEGDFSVCERYKSANAGQPVPLTLLPNGKKLKASFVKGKGRRKDV